MLQTKDIADTIHDRVALILSGHFVQTSAPAYSPLLFTGGRQLLKKIPKANYEKLGKLVPISWL